MAFTDLTPFDRADSSSILREYPGLNEADLRACIACDQSGSGRDEAVVSIEDLKRLQQLEDEEDIRDARASLKEAKKKGTIPWEKVKTELGLK